jgi:sensor histidine kinase YesM
MQLSVTLNMTAVQQYPFLFSNEKKYRIWRHVAFWGLWTIFQGFLYAFVPLPAPTGYINKLPGTMVDSLMYLPAHVFFSYTLMYFVIPFFVVKNRYVFASIWVLLLMGATACISATITLYVLEPVKIYLLPARFLFFKPGSTDNQFYLAMLAGLRGGLTIGGSAAAIKLMKHWYVEGQRNLQLQKENVESQLQLLKAQVHPHFLFNTLNNIYSKTQNIAPAASEMIFGLSDILRYMLYECNKSLVPLAQELKMMQEYIGLEKIRYGNKLDLHMDFPEVTDGYFIAPLMILPFVENCFKHGTSNILEQPWINLTITLEEEKMTMKLLNSKSPRYLSINEPGIGIENVKKRLLLLYPFRHHLAIQEEDEVFIVILKLQLEKRNVQAITNKLTFASSGN